MSSLQTSQNVVRFPSTRSLDADYGAVLPNISKQLTALRQLQRLLHEKGVPSHTHTVVPHCPLIKAKCLNDNLSALEREVAVKDEIAEQISLLEQSVSCRERRILGAETVVKTLLVAAKTDPASTAHALSESHGEDRNLVASKKRSQLRCGSRNDCNKATLPYSRYCLQHQCESSQKLYPHCTAIDSDTLIKCNNTVYDIFSGVSLCPKHYSESALASKRKTMTHLSGHVHKKLKMGSSKVVRERKAGALLNKVPVQKLKSGQQVDLKAPSLAATWSSGGDSDEPPSTTTSPSAAEGSKPVTSSKSLDDLLTLSSSLTAPLPKLDLLPLKEDIGDIMMAGEDSSGDD